MLILFISLANNASELKMLHETLRLRMMNSDLANSINFTKNIENGYDDIIMIIKYLNLL